MDGKEITVTVDEWTARRLKQLAWEHERTPENVIKECCRYGVREYEGAFGLD